MNLSLYTSLFVLATIGVSHSCYETTNISLLLKSYKSIKYPTDNQPLIAQLLSGSPNQTQQRVMPTLVVIWWAQQQQETFLRSLLTSFKSTRCLFVCVKDIDNRCNKMVLNYRKACHRYREGYLLFWIPPRSQEKSTV